MLRSIGLIAAVALLGVSCTLPRQPRSDEALNEIPTPTPSHSPSPSAKPSPDAPLFKGDIAGKAGKQKFYEFLEGRKKGPVRLDILLSDEQIADLTSVDKNRWYFDLSYPDSDNFTVGGELLIDISKGKASLKLEENHLSGLVQLTVWDGPHQGLMSVNARPLSGAEAIPSASHKPSVSPKASPSRKPAH